MVNEGTRGSPIDNEGTCGSRIDGMGMFAFTSKNHYMVRDYCLALYQGTSLGVFVPNEGRVPHTPDFL
jgi:hypothetical protein